VLLKIYEYLRFDGSVDIELALGIFNVKTSTCSRVDHLVPTFEIRLCYMFKVTWGTPYSMVSIHTSRLF